MKKTNLQLSAVCLMLGTALLFSACKKDEKTEEPATPTTTKSNTEKILGKPYKVTALSLTFPLGNIDMYSQLKDCEKDNLLTFEQPNLYTENEGATKCDSMSNQTRTGTWQWKSNETEMSVTAGGESWTWKVLTNDGTTLKVSMSKDTMGFTASLVTTMTKQP